LNDEIYKKALKYITMQDRTRRQMKIYLQKKGYNENEINECIRKLVDYNYLNDRRYALHIMVKKIKHKHYSLAMAEQYLRSELLDESVIYEAINSLGEEYEQYALSHFLTKELQNKTFESEFINKLKNKALRKGFKYYHIQEGIDNILSRMKGE